jgi:hypothetical protein
MIRINVLKQRKKLIREKMNAFPWAMNQEIVDTKYPFGVSRMNTRYPNPRAVLRISRPAKAP